MDHQVAQQQVHEDSRTYPRRPRKPTHPNINLPHKLPARSINIKPLHILLQTLSYQSRSLPITILDSKPTQVVRHPRVLQHMSTRYHPSGANAGRESGYFLQILLAETEDEGFLGEEVEGWEGVQVAGFLGEGAD